MLGFKLFGSGLPGLTVQALCQDVNASVTAAGTNQSTATELTNAVNYITTVAAGTGVVLYSGLTAGDSQLIYNAGANPLLIYPFSGAQINGIGTNAGITLPIATAIELTCISSTQLIGILSA